MEEIWDLTQSYDKSPFTNRKLKRATWQHKNAAKIYDYTTIADRLKTVSWSHNNHPTGMVKPAYERSIFPLIAPAVLLKGPTFKKFVNNPPYRDWGPIIANQSREVIKIGHDRMLP